MTPLADLELPIFAYELLETVASVDIYKNSKKIPQLWQLWIEFYHSVFVEFLGSLSKASVVLDLSISKAKKKSV